MQAESWIPTSMAVGSALMSLVLAAFLMEKLLPLRALTEHQWAYKQRPRARLWVIDQDATIQVFLFGGTGAFLGQAIGFPVLGMVLAVMLRVGIGLRVRLTLPVLLRGGRTRIIGTAALYVQDSEQVADALSVNWGGSLSGAPTGNLTVLFLRRLQRRSYLLFMGLLVLTSTIALAGVLGWLGIVAFAVAWGVVGAGVYRCAEFSRLGVDSKLPIVVIILHAVVGAISAAVVWGLGWVSICLVCLGIAWSSYRRGKPRFNADLRMFESGFGSFSPGMIDYYSRGLYGAVFLGTLATAIP